jgi:hypothetical protein
MRTARELETISPYSKPSKEDVRGMKKEVEKCLSQLFRKALSSSSGNRYLTEYQKAKEILERAEGVLHRIAADDTSPDVKGLREAVLRLKAHVSPTEKDVNRCTPSAIPSTLDTPSTHASASVPKQLSRVEFSV